MDGFWRTMARNTRCDVRKCLFGVHTMVDNILGFKFSTPTKHQKMALYRHVRTSANGFEMNDIIEDWHHWRLSVACLPWLVERRILFVAYWESPLFCILWTREACFPMLSSICLELTTLIHHQQRLSDDIQISAENFLFPVIFRIHCSVHVWPYRIPASASEVPTSWRYINQFIIIIIISIIIIIGFCTRSSAPPSIP